MEKIVETFINDTLFDFKIELPRTFGFKGTNLPLCSRQLFLDHIFPKNHTFLVPFLVRYNYHIGKALLALAQEFWAKQSLLWGDWICSDSTCGVRFNNVRLEKGLCIRCGSPAEYIEKMLTDKETSYEGRVDAVVFCTELKGYLVFSLRGRNKNVIATTDAPYPGDLYEISISAHILSQKFGLPIAGRVIFMLGKPKPRPFKFWFYESIGENLANQMLEVKRKLNTQIEKGDFLQIEGLCLMPSDAQKMNCPFETICFSLEREQLIQNKLKEYFKNEPKNI